MKNNIVDCWNWFFTIANSGDLNATEQAVLVHIIGHINRNIWSDTKIDSKIIAAAISKDVRTVKAAIKKLVKLNIIVETEGGYNIGQQPAKPRKRAKRAESAGISSQNTTVSRIDANARIDDNNGRERISESSIVRDQETTGDGDVSNIKPVARRRRLFH